MRKFSPVSAVLVILPIFTLSCGSSEPESAGTIAKVDGEIVAVTPGDEDRVCSANECEKNYIYRASFGRKRKKPEPQPPAPTPTPTATSVPVPPVDTTGERKDYSKAILQMDSAWQVTQGSREIVVAVIDTGVQTDHKDLSNNIWANQAEKNGQTGVDDDGNGYVDDVHGYDFANNRANGEDDQGHGTHCAGIIGAELNGLGTVGVSPLVKIMPVKFLDDTGSGTTAAAIKAIDYAVANGAQIISNSWGGGGKSQFLQEAIARATAKGVLVLAAAGNESNNNDVSATFPAGYPGVISVASTTDQDALSSFSNYGAGSVTIAAPGSNIYSTYVGSAYRTLSGTSMATPQVAGALALALSLNRGVSADGVKSALCDSSKKILLEKVRCGRMDVLKLLQSL